MLKGFLSRYVVYTQFAFAQIVNSRAPSQATTALLHEHLLGKRIKTRCLGNIEKQLKQSKSLSILKYLYRLVDRQYIDTKMEIWDVVMQFVFSVLMISECVVDDDIFAAIFCDIQCWKYKIKSDPPTIFVIINHLFPLISTFKWL